MKRKMLKRRSVRGFIAGVLLLGSCCISGCSMPELPFSLPFQIPVISSLTNGGGEYIFSIGTEGCTEEEAKVLLLNYQKEYSTLYGIDMWNQDAGGGDDLEAYVKDLAISQLAQVYTLNVIAKEQGVTLTDGERSLATKAGNGYYGELSSAERKYLGLKVGAITKLYERYILANKMYKSLTKDVVSEVSDEEAWIMEGEQIAVSDRETADTIHESLANGGDFSSLGSRYNEAEEFMINISKSTYPQEASDQIFRLKTGEYSDVFEMDGKYYIVYCMNAFNANLTDQNKQAVLAQRMEAVIADYYEEYSSKLDSSINQNAWDAVRVDRTLPLEGMTFFEAYDAYINNPE